MCAAVGDKIEAPQRASEDMRKSLENPLFLAGFWCCDRQAWRVLGPDMPWIMARAREGEKSAREEIGRRVLSQWEAKSLRLSEEQYRDLLRQWFRGFPASDRALERSLRRVMRWDTTRVPPLDALAALFSAHKEPLRHLEAGDPAYWEAYALLHAGFEPSANRRRGHRKSGRRRVAKALDQIIDLLAGPKLPGRPRRVGLPESDVSQAERVLEKMMVARRAGCLAELTTDEIALLLRIGLVYTVVEAPDLGQFPSLPAEMLTVLEGEAKIETGWHIRLLIPWQRRLFWRAVPGRVREWSPRARCGNGDWKDRPVRAKELLQAILRFDKSPIPWKADKSEPWLPPVDEGGARRLVTEWNRVSEKLMRGEHLTEEEDEILTSELGA